jgi:molybdenum cofactor cytidylyltransferase
MQVDAARADADAGHPPACIGILLAAGSGSRFDPSGARNKLLQALPDGQVVAIASARNLLAALPSVLAVLRPGSDALGKAFKAIGCHTTICPEAAAGMGASLAHAIAHAAHADSWIIALADMPHVGPSTIIKLREALAAGAQIAAPVCQGRRGNPVGFGRGHLPHLLALEGDAGARALLAQHPVTLVEVDDTGVLRDVDYPEDLQI